jgi:hypothetical protein
MAKHVNGDDTRRVHDGDTARDLDETRRLLYMALVTGKTKRYNLAGTLINALRHHQGVTDPDLEEQVVAQVEGTSADEAWARRVISRITTELGEA